jgi:hypothetical protein
MRTPFEIEARIQQIAAAHINESDQASFETGGQVGRDLLTADAQIQVLEWAKDQTKEAVERRLDELEQEAKRRFLAASDVAMTRTNEAEGRRLLDENHAVNMQCHELRWVLERVTEHKWIQAELG